MSTGWSRLLAQVANVAWRRRAVRPHLPRRPRRRLLLGRERRGPRRLGRARALVAGARRAGLRAVLVPVAGDVADAADVPLRRRRAPVRARLRVRARLDPMACAQPTRGGGECAEGRHRPRGTRGASPGGSGADLKPPRTPSSKGAGPESRPEPHARARAAGCGRGRDGAGPARLSAHAALAGLLANVADVAVGRLGVPGAPLLACEPRLLALLGALVVREQRVERAVAAQPAPRRAHLHRELTDPAVRVQRHRPLARGLLALQCRRVGQRLLVEVHPLRQVHAALPRPLLAVLLAGAAPAFGGCRCCTDARLLLAVQEAARLVGRALLHRLGQLVVHEWRRGRILISKHVPP